MILDLTTTKKFLGIGDSTTDVELGIFMNVAEAAWYAEGFPGESRPEVEELHGCRDVIAVHRRPVLAVSAITEGWDATAVDLAGVHVRADAGTLSKRDGDFLDPVTVSYTWGFATVPANIKQALQLLLKHLWTTQRGGGRKQGAEIEVGAAYTWPNRVLELAKPYMP